MRCLIGIVLALGVLLTGIIILDAGFEIMSTKSATEDAMAALLVGGLLSLVGITIFWAALGANSMRKKERTRILQRLVW